MYKLHYYPDNANLAPHIVLEEIGAKYELVLIDRTKNEHKSPEYLKLYPNGRIPVLIDGDLVLYETSAIFPHPVDKHPQAALAPALGSIEHAQFHKWLSWLTNTLQAELITYFYPERLTDDAAAPSQVKAHAESRVGRILDLIETSLGEGDGPYLIGIRYSDVDPFLLMLARWTRNKRWGARHGAEPVSKEGVPGVVKLLMRDALNLRTPARAPSTRAISSHSGCRPTRN